MLLLSLGCKVHLVKSARVSFMRAIRKTYVLDSKKTSLSIYYKNLCNLWCWNVEIGQCIGNASFSQLHEWFYHAFVSPTVWPIF